MKNYLIEQFNKIQKNQLLFDAIIGLYVSSILYDFITHGKMLITFLSPFWAIVVVSIVNIFFMGMIVKVYNTYKESNYPKYLTKLMGGLMIIMVFFQYVMVPANLINAGIIHDTNQIMILFVLGIFTLLGGFMLTTKEELAVKLGMAAFIICIPLTFYAIYLAAVIGESVMPYIGKALGIIAGILSGVLLIGVSGLFIYIFAFDVPERISKFKYFASTGFGSNTNNYMKFGISIFTALLLCFWDEMYTGLTQNNMQSSGIKLIILGIFSGIIPWRILLFLQPPFNIINAIAGITSTGLMIYMLIK